MMTHKSLNYSSDSIPRQHETNRKVTFLFTSFLNFLFIFIWITKADKLYVNKT